TTYLFGIRLDNPEAQWPTAQQTVPCSHLPNMSCFPDDDDDGQPGLTVTLVTQGMAPSTGTDSCQSRGYEYRAAPLSGSPVAIFDGVRRADRIQLGVRSRVGISVRFGDDCATGKGSAVAQYVNSRATGCLVQAGSCDLIGDR